MLSLLLFVDGALSF